MDDAFGNALMVEMEDFLAEGEILEQGRPACAGAKRILIVGDTVTEIIGEISRRIGDSISDLLMQFIAIAPAVTRRSEARRVGKSVSVRVDLGGRGCIKKNTKQQ